MTQEYEALMNQEEALEANRVFTEGMMRLWDSLGSLDFERAQMELAELRLICSRFGSEPAHLSTEIRYLQCAAALGETYIEAEQCEVGYGLLIAVWEDLLEFQSRMRSLGLPSKGSNVVNTLIADFASVKWHYPEYQARWPSLAEMHKHYYEASSRLLEHCRLRSPAGESGMSQSTLDSMTSAGTGLAILDYSFHRDELGTLLTFLQTHIGLELSPECFAFRDIDPASRQDRCYWDFEIAKMMVKGAGGLADYDYCCDKRRRILLREIGQSDAAERLWARERQHFMRGLALAPVQQGITDEAVSDRRKHGGA